MTDAEQRLAAKKFAEDWEGKGYEKGMSQPFWLSLLRDVFGVEHPEQFIIFEEQVKLDNTSFIDGTIPETKVLIEQKGLSKNLRKPIKQSDGSLLTPFQQAKRYITELPVSQHPRWVVTCNFSEFHIYDMEQPSGDPEIVYLKDLGTDYYRLQFLVDKQSDSIKKEMDLSLQAGELVGVLYDEILKQYKNPESEETLKSLNMLCVRLVFCLYAEDAGVFGSHNMFHDYLKGVADKDIDDVRDALVELFKILDTKEEDRDPYKKPELLAFPYVNGGLFADENIIIPRFNEKIVNLLLQNASADFNWSEISPTIFGAVFESTLNPDTRRKGGMHYTSIENIHKVIDPLFLDDLVQEFESIIQIGVLKTRKEKLEAFQNKLASLKFLDPACGSGNFLTETYISIRRLENKVIIEKLACEKGVTAGQIVFGDVINPIKVSISQFYGIEINDFAVTVGKTALWIAESQMLKETEDIIHMNLDFLPLKTNAYIVEGNALHLDWGSVVPAHELSYIMGNPPFVGMKYQSKEQKADMADIFNNIKNYGSLDYVASWYKKSADFIKGTNIEVAFVSTNSITQGEQTAILWKPLFENNICINFAYRTFKWNSEASDKAAVHCVIVGFGNRPGRKKKILIQNEVIKREVININGYLLDAPDVFVSNRSKPLCNVPKLASGNKPVDGDNLKIEKEDYEDFIKMEPKSIKYIKKLVGGYEFINNVDRYVLWLVNATPDEIKSMPLVMDRVQKVRQARLEMIDEGAQKLADTPTTFRDTLNPEQYIVIPIVSSENRRYVPMGFLDGNTIPTNQVQIIPDASLYHFGVLESNVHMAWMRAVCGRLKSDYRYTAKIVYNNFPWCNPTTEQKAKIEQTAQMILDARALYPDSSLADLYNEVLMPPELRKAHLLNDKAVMDAYGFTKDTEAYRSESACVAELMKMYQEKVSKL